MNKNFLVAFCGVAAVLLLLLIAMLISRNQPYEQEGNASTQNTTGFSAEATDVTDTSAVADTSEKEGSQETMESVIATLGVISGGCDETPVEEPEGNTTAATKPETQDPEQSAPTESSAPTQQPDPTTQTEGGQTLELITYEAYLELDPAQRRAYYEQFANEEDFVMWFNAAKDDYENGDSIEIGTGPIDMEEILTP